MNNFFKGVPSSRELKKWNGRFIALTLLSLSLSLYFPSFVCPAQLPQESRTNSLDCFRSFLSDPPTIKCLVFERITKGTNTIGSWSTQVYCARLQGSDFAMEQIQKVEDAFPNISPRLPITVGRSGGNCWSIEYGILKLFPKEGQNDFDGGAMASVWFGYSLFINVLHFGISDIATETVEWISETNFVARTLQGDRINGSVAFAPITMLLKEINYTHDRSRKSFHRTFGYEKVSWQSCLPSSITNEVSSADGERTIAAITRIHRFEVSPSALSTDLFTPKSFLGSNIQHVISHTNNESYVVRPNKKPEKTLSPGSGLEIPPNSPHVLLRKYFVIGLFVVTTVLFLYAFNKFYKKR